MGFGGITAADGIFFALVQVQLFDLLDHSRLRPLEADGDLRDPGAVIEHPGQLSFLFV